MRLLTFLTVRSQFDLLRAPVDSPYWIRKTSVLFLLSNMLVFLHLIVKPTDVFLCCLCNGTIAVAF